MFFIKIKSQTQKKNSQVGKAATIFCDFFCEFYMKKTSMCKIDVCLSQSDLRLIIKLSSHKTQSCVFLLPFLSNFFLDLELDLQKHHSYETIETTTH